MHISSNVCINVLSQLCKCSVKLCSHPFGFLLNVPHLDWSGDRFLAELGKVSKPKQSTCKSLYNTAHPGGDPSRTPSGANPRSHQVPSIVGAEKICQLSYFL